MSFSKEVLRNDELAIYQLRELYRKYGYTQYKVSRFEEYDLYARNKRFLVSENILTFTDTNGKLMALKPDVTLSIIKNITADDGETHKLYYNENVYRTSAESHGFKEIVQTGLECIGTIDTFAESEVVMLGIKSLESISGDYIMDISHMGIIEGLLDSTDMAETDRRDVLKFVECKNIAEIRRLCDRCCVDGQVCDNICALTEMYLPLSKALAELDGMVINERMRGAYEELCQVCDMLSQYGISDRLYFDFSVVNDCNYYDGIIFKGFINSIPDSVLSGGRYDRLLDRMGKKLQAIGFAVYLDRLERFGAVETSYDTDVLLVYDDEVSADKIIKAVERLLESGRTVKTARKVSEAARYRQIMKIDKGGVTILEAND